MSSDNKEAMDRIQRSFEEKRRKMAEGKAEKKHVVESGETLSHIALKYYGSAAKEKWMAIYEANKGVIGENPNRIKTGQELVIPDID